MTEACSLEELTSRAVLAIASTQRSVGEHGFPFAAGATDGDHRWTLTHGEFWTEGLWLGQLWSAYHHSGDDAFRLAAESMYERIRHRRVDASTHDLGFLFVPSALAGWEATGRERYRLDALEAAATLATRYDPECQLILAWDVLDGVPVGRVAIIDTLVNLQLLYWASSQPGGGHLGELARPALDQMIRLLIRPDGSIRQMVRFEGTGRDLRSAPVQHQGYARESCWSRGLGWGIYGLACAYTHYADPSYLAKADQLVAYYRANVPADLVPSYDFADPGGVEGAPRDSSAATITAAGLAKLWHATGGERYRQLAHDIAYSLTAHRYFVADQENARGLIAHGCFHYPKRQFVDAQLVFGDYYFVEALTLLQSEGRTDSPRRGAT